MSNYLIEKFQKGYPGAVEGTHSMLEYRESILNRVIFKNVNRNFVNDFSSAELEFINSKCACDLIKELMTICLRNSEGFKEEESEAMKLLQDEKTFNEMSAEEIEKLVEELGDSRGFHRVPELYKRYFFTISGKGVNEYLLTRVDKYDIVQEFLQTSGLSTRAEYYAGCGVRYWDLGPDHLKSIYYKFSRLNPESAVEFYKMVISMDTLGASEFIDTLYRFARNDFKTEGLTVAKNNLATDNATNDSMYIGLIAALGNNQSEEDQVRLSNNMKVSFFWDVYKSLSKLDPELCEKHIEVVRKKEMEDRFYRGRKISNESSNKRTR